MPYTFVEPATVAEAEERMRDLSERISEIELSLGDRDRRARDGSRLTGEDYFKWRKQARIALRLKQSEHKYLKEWVRERRESATEAWLARTASAPNSCEVILNGMVTLVGVLIGEHRYTLTESERGLMAAARMYRDRSMTDFPPIPSVTGSFGDPILTGTAAYAGGGYAQ